MTFYHQCDQLCNTFIYLNQYVLHDILNMEYIYKCHFVSWFIILSQYDANIAFLLHFGMVMQYPFDSLNQNNLAHHVYIIPQAWYRFGCKFW
jgi:hypothetical protein